MALADDIARICLALLVVLPLVHGQAQDPPQIFEWGFSGTQTVSTSLPSCRTFPIEVYPRISNGTPPYYMTAFAVGGAPITTFIGNNGSNLSWTVGHPIGTQLILHVWDSRGGSGGIDVPIYTVIEGATTQCIPPASTEPPFKVVANVTDVLNTCQPWGLTIQGGTPPYNVTLAATNSSDVTNSTLGPNDSYFTYINRADPGRQLMASVSDLDGRWATGSPIVRTQGSTDVNCSGLVDTGSTTGPAPNPSQSSALGAGKLASRARIGIIVGAVLGGILLLCAVGIWWKIRQKRQKLRAQHEMVDIAPFFAAPGGDGNINAPMLPPPVVIHPSSTSSAPSKSRSNTASRQTLRNTSSTDSRSSPSGTTVSLPVVRELPPPYAFPLPQDDGPVAGRPTQSTSNQLHVK
ncbi:hypothetical protein C8R43DRAFT_956364 [Mycena crocata]|nr:hypothetical protein C8R43DRAFT_956364 [Mycena crocata]